MARPHGQVRGGCRRSRRGVERHRHASGRGRGTFATLPEARAGTTLDEPAARRARPPAVADRFGPRSARRRPGDLRAAHQAAGTDGLDVHLRRYDRRTAAARRAANQRAHRRQRDGSRRSLHLRARGVGTPAARGRHPQPDPQDFRHDGVRRPAARGGGERRHRLEQASLHPAGVRRERRADAGAVGRQERQQLADAAGRAADRCPAGAPDPRRRRHRPRRPDSQCGAGRPRPRRHAAPAGRVGVDGRRQRLDAGFRGRCVRGRVGRRGGLAPHARLGAPSIPGSGGRNEPRPPGGHRSADARPDGVHRHARGPDDGRADHDVVDAAESRRIARVDPRRLCRRGSTGRPRGRRLARRRRRHRGGADDRLRHCAPLRPDDGADRDRDDGCGLGAGARRATRVPLRVHRLADRRRPLAC